MTNIEELRAILLKATPGVWKLTLSKNGRWQISNGLVQIAQVWTTISNPAMGVGTAIATLHNVAPMLLDELEAARAEIERLKRDVTRIGAAEAIESLIATWDTPECRDLLSIWDLKQEAVRLREGSDG